MNQRNSFKSRLQAGLSLAALTAALLAVSAAYLGAADSTPAKDSAPAKDAKPEKKVAKTSAKKKLTGAELYAIHCNRCHPERYATERTAAQWNTVMLHMRVRAFLPADQAKTILKYLQEDSGK